MAFGAWEVFDLVTAALQLALAGFLLWTGVGREANRALTLFLVARSGYLGIRLLPLVDPTLAGLADRLADYLLPAMAILLLQLASVFPVRRRWIPAAPWDLLPAATAMGALWLLQAAQPPGSDRLGLVHAALATVAFIGVALILVREHGRHPLEHIGQAALMAAAGFALARAYDVILLGALVLRTEVPAWLAVLAAVEIVLFGLFTAELLRQSRSGRGGAEGARNALAVLTLAYLSGLVVTLLDPAAERDTGLGSLWNLGIPLLVAYAILRHHLFGIDVKIRWTISKGTVAAVFIAVFFLATELAQQFLGETFGSAYVGILAAGALVFAMAPLQRLADALATRAVPPAPVAAADASAAESAYREVLRRFLRDGVLTREEEGTLARLAEGLGIGAGRAFALRAEEERRPNSPRP